MSGSIGILYWTIEAPAGGAAAAAPERGALGGPSAPTSTSTRWALVTMQPCQAWHGRGLNEVPPAAIRGISSCREARYGGFWKNIISVHRHLNLPLGQSYMSFPRLNTRRYSPDDGAGAAFAKIFWRRRVRTDRRRDEGVEAGGGQLGSSAS
jgi:hypothetical protein